MSIVAACLFIPLSTSLMVIFSILTLFFWIISGKVFNLPQHMRKSPVVFFATGLFLVLALGLLYTPAPAADAVDVLLKYRELLFIPAVIALFQGHEEYPRMAENSFVTGCIILMLISYGMYFSILPPHKYGYSILYHITHSFFMGVLGFWSLHRAFDSKQYRYLWIVIFLATSINILYVGPGRTGMLVYILLLLLALFQRLSLKKLIIALVLVAASLSAAYVYSHNFSSRIQTALAEIQNYQPQKSRTSLGMRFDWWQNSVDLIEEAPVFGHGIGSYAVLQKRLIKEMKTMPSDNPHNEYLFIGVQTGLLGLFIFVALFFSQLGSASRLPLKDKYLMQGVVLAIASGCTINSFLYDAHQGHFFAILSGVLLSTISSRKTLTL
jgi:O-antigen ligase